MQHLNSKVKQQQLCWRRSEVLRYSAEGYSQREIAQKLQVDLATVNRDIHHLKQEAQENLHKHIHEVIPLEYEKAMLGMKRNLKQTLEIAETVSDPKTKLQARAIVNDCYKYIMDLITNGTIVTDAIKYVTQKQEKIDTLHMIDERIKNFDVNAAEGEEATSSGVF
jgi:DNA-binding transcriptional regulator LsrR (DeoR family)